MNEINKMKELKMRPESYKTWLLDIIEEGLYHTETVEAVAKIICSMDQQDFRNFKNRYKAGETK